MATKVVRITIIQGVEMQDKGSTLAILIDGDNASPKIIDAAKSGKGLEAIKAAMK